jgi:hypothetical protein
LACHFPAAERMLKDIGLKAAYFKERKMVPID